MSTPSADGYDSM